MTTTDALPAHTTSDRPHVLDACPHLRELRELPAVRRVRTFTGDEAWLVTHHAEVKKLLMDSRIGRSHPDPDNMPKFAGNPMFDFILGDEHDASDEYHAKTRAILKPHFTPKKMLALRPRIDTIAGEILDVLISKGPPADLHADFSVPFALRTICELLGVPIAEREQCAALMAQLGNTADPGGAFAAMQSLLGYLRVLAARKRSDPGDDLISGLGPQCDDDTIARMTILLMFTGFGSIVSQVDSGFLLWMTNPEQRDAVVQNPALLPNAVEEVLRMVGTLTLARYSRQDIEIGGVTIRPNELVLLDPTLANYDDNVFDHPERFDINRSPNSHLSFGHGRWNCLGTALVRIELQAAFTALSMRLPTACPAVPVEQLRKSSDQLSSGIGDLQVTW